jgi:hypothetical protein
MNKALHATFPTSPVIFSGAHNPIKYDLVASQRRTIAALGAWPMPQGLMPTQNITLGPQKSETVLRSVTHSADFHESIFNSLVSLKVAVSKYAMHLSSAERKRIFEQLDSVINVDDWHDGDDLPKPNSFEEFLKWMIYSKYFKWTSIGVSQEGNIMVAWRTRRVLLTANFAGADNVRWTAQIHSDVGETGHTVGKCPLRLFAEQAIFYLHGPERHEDH